MSLQPSVPTLVAWCLVIATATAPAPAWDLRQTVTASGAGGRPRVTATTRAVNASSTTRTMVVSSGPACGAGTRLTIKNQHGKTVFDGDAPCEPLELAVRAGGYLELSISRGSYDVSLR